MIEGIMSDSRTLRDTRDTRDTTETTVRPVDIALSAREGTAPPDLRVRCRDLEARIELLENALATDRLHVDTIREGLQELQIRTTGLADELQVPDTPRPAEQGRAKGKESKQMELGDFDGFFLALICFIVWITVGCKVIYAD